MLKHTPRKVEMIIDSIACIVQDSNGMDEIERDEWLGLLKELESLEGADTTTVTILCNAVNHLHEVYLDRIAAGVN